MSFSLPLSIAIECNCVTLQLLGELRSSRTLNICLAEYAEMRVRVGIKLLLRGFAKASLCFSEKDDNIFGFSKSLYNFDFSGSVRLFRCFKK